VYSVRITVASSTCDGTSKSQFVMSDGRTRRHNCSGNTFALLKYSGVSPIARGKFPSKHTPGLADDRVASYPLQTVAGILQTMGKRDWKIYRVCRFPTSTYFRQHHDQPSAIRSGTVHGSPFTTSSTTEIERGKYRMA
jgi:hypothetical protein